jgi:hypothetical protein
VDAVCKQLPFDGEYWRIAGTPFSYPLITVFAPDKATADIIAGSWHSRRAQLAYCELAMDSAEAQNRLGIFGRPDLAAQMRRGD